MRADLNLSNFHLTISKTQPSIRWNELHERINTAKKASPAMAQVAHDVMRDGHCHEAVMWYVHHLTADVKAAIKGIELPLLSEAHHGEDGGACSEGALARNYWSDPTGALTQACQVYEEKVTCASCHSDAA